MAALIISTAAFCTSTGCKEHDGEIVTIKALCPFTWAYELEDLLHLWHDNCLREVRECSA